MWRKLTILIVIVLGLAGGIQRAGAATPTAQAEQAVRQADQAVTNARRANALADKAEKEGQKDAQKKREAADQAAWDAAIIVHNAQPDIDAIPEGHNPRQKERLQKELDKLDAIQKVLIVGVYGRSGPFLSPFDPPPSPLSESEREDLKKKQLDSAIEEAQKAIDKLDPRDGKQLQKQLEDQKKLLLAARPPGEPANLATLMAQGKVAATIESTGEIVGIVAALGLKNLTQETLRVDVPSTVLVSKSGKFQNYVLPRSHATELAPGEAKTLSLRGVCLDPDRPAVEKGNTEEFAIAAPSSLSSKLRELLADTRAVFAAAEGLQAKGAYDKIPYYSRTESFNIVTLWTTWANTAEKAGTPLTKSHLSKRVYEDAGAVAERERQELESGIEQIWAAVQKTLEEARKTKPAVASAKPKLYLSSTTQGQRTTIELFDHPRDLQKVLFYQEDKKGRKLIGEASRAHGFGVGDDPEVWRAQWVSPKADAVEISAWALAGGKLIRLLTQPFKLDPLVKIIAPKKSVECVKSGPIRLQTDVPAGSKVSFTIERAVYYTEGKGIQAKGLPEINQLEADDEGTLTDGTENENFPDALRKPGALSCAPTAVASSLKWFAKNGYPKLVDENISDKDLVQELGQLSGTGKPDKKKNGNSPQGMKEGIEKYLEKRGLKDEFEVGVKENPTPEDIVNEVGRGQDVTLWYRHRKYEKKDGTDMGHVVAVDGVSAPDANGAIKVRIMNPRNGQHEDITINADGSFANADGTPADGTEEKEGADTGGPLTPPPESGKKGAMLHISPKETRGDFPPLHKRTYSGGKMVATVSLPRLEAGRYLLTLSATDKRGTYTDTQLLFVNPCP